MITKRRIGAFSIAVKHNPGSQIPVVAWGRKADIISDDALTEPESNDDPVFFEIGRDPEAAADRLLRELHEYHGMLN